MTSLNLSDLTPEPFFWLPNVPRSVPPVCGPSPRVQAIPPNSHAGAYSTRDVPADPPALDGRAYLAASGETLSTAAQAAGGFFIPDSGSAI